jgi:hypothetical protein
MGCVERGCPRPNSHIPQIHPQKKVFSQETKILDTYQHLAFILEAKTKQ